MNAKTTDFLDEFEPDAVESTTDLPEQPAADPVADPSKGPARGPDGKFARVEAEEKGVAAAETPQAETEPPSEPEGPHVPRAALEAERRKRQEIAAELAALKAAQSAQPPRQPEQSREPVAPLRFEDDPRAYIENVFEQQERQNRFHRFEVSKFLIAQQYGEEETEAAVQAFMSDPEGSELSWKIANHPQPVAEVMKWYRAKQDRLMLQEAGGLEKLKERWIAEALASRPQQGAPATAAPARAAVPKPQAPPSLSRGAGAASIPETTDDDVFEEMFGSQKTRKR